MSHIHTLRKKNFLIWRPGITNPAPYVFIGQLKVDTQKGDYHFIKHGEFQLKQSSNHPDVWAVDCKKCKLKSGEVYYYWFKVANTNPYENNSDILYCSDPFATAVDERIQARNLPVPELRQNHYSPASVVLFKDGELHEADPDSCQPDWENTHTKDVVANLAPNNKLVIYELPPRWSSSNGSFVNGNFRQVEKMIDVPETDTYLDVLFNSVLNTNGEKYIAHLGVNALELTPPANSSQEHNWGYGTASYLAPDFNLSVRNGNSSNNLVKPASDFVNLVKACHRKGIRFIYDAVMAFASNNPYKHINFTDFFIHWGTNDPEQSNRDGFGGDLIKYKYYVQTYNPSNGNTEYISPSREYMKVHLREWIKTKGVSGLRLDSVNNIDCYDFLKEVKNETRNYFKTTTNATDDKYLVVAEELSVPKSLLEQGAVDGQWNEHFKQIIRELILGRGWRGNNFEWSIRKMLDCRLLGKAFTDGAQAVNYLTSHDVGGYQNERFYSYLNNNGVYDTKDRIKLAFSCLFTSIGIPMILAGDEFAEQQDLYGDEDKQRDPVNYERLKDSPWRQEIFEHVRSLIKLRKNSDALASNTIEFIHFDFNEGKRVVAWKREFNNDTVITVANFSDWGSQPNTEYRINNWPAIPTNKKWYEATQNRLVDSNWYGRESIYPWEAKVYVIQ